MKRLDDLASLARRAERIANPAVPRAPCDAPVVYRLPKKTRPGHVCWDCGRLISYASGKQCIVCYRTACRKRYEEKVALRELKMRVAREAGL